MLRSADYGRSRAFYADTLGYAICEEGGDPPRFGIFERGRSILFVNSWNGGPAQSPGGWDAYVHVTGLQALYDEFAAAGAEIARSIEATVYDMREFEVRDPDGNVICFGEDIPSDTN